MRVVVMGASGRLGSALLRLGPELGWEVLPLDRSGANLENPGALVRALQAIEFDALVNAAAMTDVEACEETPEQAWRVNAEAPRVLAESCAARGSAFLHVSTDYVFAGHEPGLKRESDAVGAVNVYGRSKAAGEEAVLQMGGPRHWVARVAWLFGSGRDSAFDFVLERAARNEEMTLVADKYSSPTFCDDAVRTFDRLLRRQGPGGVIHVVNEGCVSWWEYGCAVIERARSMGWSLRVRQVDPVTLQSMTQWKARRPCHTALAADLAGRLTGAPMRPWTAAAEDYLRIKLNAKSAERARGGGV
ncbi:MAG TPA: dTDP-4-dehydrorhamnose reductase [Verrucomicrobiales bacterium]|nr:dTDP-4-dehydrorhamnose reductase [Verrucomicrobiales bacterium]